MKMAYGVHLRSPRQSSRRVCARSFEWLHGTVRGAGGYAHRLDARNGCSRLRHRPGGRWNGGHGRRRHALRRHQRHGGLRSGRDALWHRGYGRHGSPVPESAGVPARGRDAATFDEIAVPQRRARHFRGGGQCRQPRTRQLERQLRGHRRLGRRVLGTGRGAVPRGYRERREHRVRGRHEAVPVPRLHAHRRDERHLPAGIPADPGAARLAPPAGGRGARPTDGRLRQGFDRSGRRRRGCALGHGGALRYPRTSCIAPSSGRPRTGRSASPTTRLRPVCRSWCGAACRTRHCSTRPRAACSRARKEFEPRRRVCSTRPLGARPSGRSPKSTCGSIVIGTQAKEAVALSRIRRRAADRDGARHAGHLGSDRIRRPNERARSLHHHEGRRQRRPRQALRPRRDWSYVHHLPDTLAAGRRPAHRHSRQGRLPFAVRKPKRGIPDLAGQVHA